MKRNFILLFLLFLSQPLFSSETPPKAEERWGVVRVPVADLRASSGSIATSYEQDPLQETQLLYGEVVKIVQEHGDWLFVSAIEQQEFSHNDRWEGYPGWVKKSSVLEIKRISVPNFVVKGLFTFVFPKPAILTEPLMRLSIGTKLVADDKLVHRIVEKEKFSFRRIKTVEGGKGWILDEALHPIKKDKSEDYLRKLIVDSASEFLSDQPYFWGGRSAHMPALKEQITAVDCSGLTNLAYRVAGIEIPRDSLEQYMKAKKIKASEMKMGDLIFSASKEKPEKISHVAIFIDTARLIEAPQTGMTVRTISYKEKFGVPFSELENGKLVGERVIYFGTYLGR